MPQEEVILSGWFCKKKKGTIFAHKLHARTFWRIEGLLLQEYLNDSSIETKLSEGDNEETDFFTFLKEFKSTKTLVFSGERLLASHDISTITALFKEKTDELLFSFKNDTTLLALKAESSKQRDAWFDHLSRLTTKPNRVTTVPINFSPHMSSSNKDRMSNHFSKAQFLAKQITQKNEQSQMRKQASGNQLDANSRGNKRIVIVPTVKNEEHVERSRFLKTPEQNAMLLQAIERDLFPRAVSVFPRVHVRAQAVVDLMFSVKFGPNTDVVVQGDPTDRMFVIEQGNCGVYSQDFSDQPPHFEIMKTTGDSFGLLALLYTQPAPFTIRSEEKSLVWALPRNKFFELMRNLTKRNHGHKLHLLYESLKDPLEALLGTVSVNVMEQIADCMEMQIFKSGEVIVQQGENVKRIIIVDKGKIQSDLLELNEGDMFGSEILNSKTSLLSSSSLVADSKIVVVYSLRLEEVLDFFDSASQREEEEKQQQPVVMTSKCSVVHFGKRISRHQTQLLSVNDDSEVGGEVDAVKPFSRSTAATTTVAIEGENDNQNDGVEEVEDGDLRVNLDLQFTPNLPRRRPELDGVDKFEFLGFLGRGQFGSVHRVRVLEGKVENECFALKVLQGNVITLNGWEQMVENERDAMVELSQPMKSSPFLCHVFNYFGDFKNVYFLLELVPGGTLQEAMKLEEDSHLFDQTDFMQFYLGSVVLGLEAIHRVDICYRDLKPENIMLTRNGYCKLADFGLAKKTRRTFTFCGTPEYMPPETLLNRGHGLAVDWWASGIFLFELLCGYTPFAAFECSDTYDKILAYSDAPNDSLLGYSKLTEHDPKFAPVRELIAKLLHPKQNKRLGVKFPGVSGIKRDSFFEGFGWVKLERQELKSPYIPIHCREVSTATTATPRSTSKYDPNIFSIPDDMTGWTRKF